MGTSSTMSALTGLLLVLQLVAVLQASPLQNEWEMYKMKHGKEYATPAEEERRRSIWLDNIHNVAEHNKKENDFTMAINQFSDMTNEEFNNYLGYKMPLEKAAPVNRKIFRNVKTPSRVDYRSEGLVTPAKNQGQCGSCWAFSAIGSMEGAWAKQNGLVSLSEQEIVDCGSGSCNGGLMPEGFKTAINMGGIESESSYPYEHVDYNGCRYNAANAAAHITGYQAVYPGENQLEMALVQAGHPISVAVHAGSGMQQYHGGIYSDPTCRYYQLNHGVLLVGYDKTDPNNSYWIVKNSWGSGWGESGFIKMKMGQNICGISKDPSYATL